MNTTFKSGVTRPLAYRRKQLLQLARLLQDNITALEDAELEDLGKPRQEVTMMELSTVISSCLHAAEHLEEWTKSEKPIVEDWKSSWDTTIYKVPKGVALIISYVCLQRLECVVLRLFHQPLELSDHSDIPPTCWGHRGWMSRGPETLGEHSALFCSHGVPSREVP